jgi:uncharacterized protein GlcG (DUF336 family)
MRHHSSLPYAVAELVADACRAEAQRLAIPMAVATVDAEGGLQSFSRMDGTLPVSTELAVSKAYTAALLRMPTHELGKLAQPGQPLYGIETSHNGKIVLFGGGFPLSLDGVVAGAIGISGGTVEEDMQVARTGVALLADMEVLARQFGGSIRPDLAAIPALERVKTALARELGVQAAGSSDGPALDAAVGGILLALA